MSPKAEIQRRESGYDAQLRLLTLVVLLGLGVLLAGLWWVQIVSAREFQAHLETQSFRSVRIPAVRGKILDRNGIVLAENRPTYNLSLYLEELRKAFDGAYSNDVRRTRLDLKRELEEQEQKVRRKLSREERRQFLLTSSHKAVLRKEARYEIASNALMQVRLGLQQPLALDPALFERHYETRLALPFPVLSNLTSLQIARFEEQSASGLGIDLEVQSTRFYPAAGSAAHLLGWLEFDDSSAEGEEAFFSYRLPDYRGRVGIEAAFDAQLRGRAGAKSVLVNNIGYRQTENIWSPAEPGRNVALTIDARIQRAVERALPVYGPATRGAAVVMDVRTGDVLALASCPTLDPNEFVHGITRTQWERLNDPKLRPQVNRATQENYAPGSIFKTVVAMACLENGLDPLATYHVQPDPSRPGKGCIYLGRRKIEDTAPSGDYDFGRAVKLSSNAYFVTNGLRVGIENIVKFGQRLHLGESFGLRTRQETKGIFPSLKRISANWFDGDTANVCIGQGPIAVTPLQMAVMTAAIANGGKVLWPRLVERIERPEPGATEASICFPAGRVRDELGVQPRNLLLLREAMLKDVEDPDGTGRKAAVKDWRVCGKTGTAQVQNERGQTVDHITWFISFAPYEQPRYAVVIMIESGGSGGTTCAPVAGAIYTALVDCERAGRTGETVARAEEKP